MIQSETCPRMVQSFYSNYNDWNSPRSSVWNTYLKTKNTYHFIKHLPSLNRKTPHGPSLQRPWVFQDPRYDSMKVTLEGHKPRWKQGQNSPNKTHDLDQLNGKSGGLGQGWWFEIRIEFNLLSDSLPGYFQGFNRNPNQPGPKPPLVDLMINGLKTWSFSSSSFHVWKVSSRWKWTTKKWRLLRGE